MPINDIKPSDVKVGKRFRKSIGDTSGLRASIISSGLMHPIVVDKDLNLIAGQRRLSVFLALGRKTIPAMVISPKDARLAEAQENGQRMQWTDIERENLAKELSDADYSQEEIGVAIGIAQNSVSELLTAKKIREENVSAADNISSTKLSEMASLTPEERKIVLPTIDEETKRSEIRDRVQNLVKARETPQIETVSETPTRVDEVFANEVFERVQYLERIYIDNFQRVKHNKAFKDWLWYARMRVLADKPEVSEQTATENFIKDGERK